MAAALDSPHRADVLNRLARLRALVRSREVFLVMFATLIGIAAGALVQLMATAAQLAHVLIYDIPLDEHLSASARIDPKMALTAPVVGGLILGAMELWRRKRKIPQAVDPVEANALRGGRMSLRDSLVVSLQTLISNGCGASVGLEAGYTQIGAGLASWLGVKLGLRRSDMRVLLGAGAAGAIAAAFGAPLTGAFYAFELIIGVYSVASVAPVMAAALAATVVAQTFGGAPYKIEVVSIFAVRPVHFVLIVAIGVAVGALGIAVMRSVTLFERVFERSPIPFWLRPAVGGLAVGTLAMLTPQVLAAGHGAMLLDLSTETTWTLLVTLIALKLLAVMVSLGSGFRGGLFFASLFVGALFGKLCGQGAQAALPEFGLDPVICTLTGMGALAVAIVGGPVTMSFLVLETTGNLSVAGAVLAACVACSLFVREVFGYSFSTWRLHLRGETIRSAADVGWIRALTVGRMMRRDPPTIDASSTIAEFRRRYPLGSTHAVLLVDEQGHYHSVLPTPEAFAARHDAVATTLRVGEIGRCPDVTLTPELNVKAAMTVFDRSEAETLAVVDSHDSKTVIGLCTEAFITRRYAEELDKASRGIHGE